MQERSIKIVIIIVLTIMSGCATLDNKPATPLSKALVSLHSGNELVARKQLEQIVAAPPESGVTDEAIFRLALLTLRDNGATGQTGAMALLEQLSKNFPESTWTRQAEPLISLLANVKSIRKRQSEVKVLRERNSALNREKRALLQKIERMKELDLELDQKTK